MTTTPPFSDSPLPAAAEAVLTFLESVGRRSEAELYLRLFRGVPRESFAIVAAEGPVLRGATGVLLEQLRFLSAMGLVAPVVVGLFEPERARYGTDQLAEHLPSIDLTARLHTLGSANLTESVVQQLRAGEVPVLSFSPESDTGLEARFEHVGQLARQLGSRKIVIVRRHGGLSGPDLSVVNLRTDLQRLLASGRLSSEDGELLVCVRRLLEASQSRQLTVSVTSPLTLLRELFTVKGSGTLIKAGSEIRRVPSYDELSRPRLRALLEASFERPLREDFLDRAPLRVYLESDYRGVAILEPSPVAPYLSKFAVEPLAQGEGIGQDLWQALTQDEKRLVWRSRTDNPIVRWYFNICDGTARSTQWRVFWRGLDPEEIPDAISMALARPPDLLR